MLKNLIRGGNCCHWTYSVCFVAGVVLFILISVSHGSIGWHFWRQPLSDLAFMTVATYALQVLWGQTRLRYVVRGLAFLFVLVYLVQSYYFAISDEYITVLALENIDQFYLLLNPVLVVSIVVVVAIAAGVSWLLCRRPLTVGRRGCWRSCLCSAVFSLWRRTICCRSRLIGWRLSAKSVTLAIRHSGDCGRMRPWLRG